MADEPYDAMAEVAWVARTARDLVYARLDRPAAAEYFERKARLLDHLASVAPGMYPEAVELAAVAREHARMLTAGVEWPPDGATLSWETT